MPFRGNFRQHFPPDFQHGNNAHFYAPNNGNTAHGASMPPFFNGTGPPGTQYAGFPGPQSTFPPQMFHGQPEFVPHMNNNPHQHPQYYPPPPPPNDVHLNFVSAQQQQQLYPYPQQTPSQQATNLSLPPTLSSFLPFSSPLNGNHSQVRQHGPPALAPHQQLIHHTLPQAPPQQYQFHADMSFGQNSQPLPPQHLAQPVPVRPSHPYSEGARHEHLSHSLGNVPAHKAVPKPPAPVPVPSPYVDETPAPKAVPPPLLHTATSSISSDSSKVAYRSRHSTDDPDFYDPAKEIEQTQKLGAKFKTEHRHDSNDQQSKMLVKPKEEQLTQPKKLPIWLRESLENAKELGKTNKKQNDVSPKSDHDEYDDEIDSKPKLDEKDRLKSEPIKLTQKQFDRVIMMHTRTLLTELLLSATNDTIQNTCKTGITKKTEVKLEPKHSSSSSSSLSSRGALIASTKPSVAKTMSGSRNSGNSFSSAKESFKKAEVTSSAPVSGVPVVSNIIASTYLGQLSGHYGSSSDEESDKELQQKKNQVEEKNKSSQSSRGHSSRRDDKDKNDSKSKDEHRHRHTSSDASDRYKHRENDRRERSPRLHSRDRNRNQSRSKNQSRSRSRSRDRRRNAHSSSSSSSRRRSSEHRDREHSRSRR